MNWDRRGSLKSPRNLAVLRVSLIYKVSNFYTVRVPTIAPVSFPVSNVARKEFVAVEPTFI